MQKTKVWDGFIRFFHWSLVALIITLYFSAENGMMELHFVAGFSLSALLISRLIWGIIGSETAKLSALFHSPKAALLSIKGEAQQKAGHNAAGSYMVIAFLLLLVSQALTGLMTTDDIMYDGPLVAIVADSWVNLASTIHKQLFDFILITIALHIAAIVTYKIKGKPLVGAMLSGKTTKSYEQNIKMKSGWVGFIIFLVNLIVINYFWGRESLTTLVS